MNTDRSGRVIRRFTVAGLVCGFVPFLAVLWNLRVDPLRSARAEGFSSNFYDLQARALFDGHLDLPDRILGIESFVHHGKTFMYFPPFPALLRMPILAVTDRLDGRLTAPSMLVAWCVLAASATCLVWRARRLVRGDSPVGLLDAAASAVLIASVTGGTVLLYIASLPWVYHEVYMWSAAFTVGALAGFAGLALSIDRPRWRDIALVGGCVAGAILTRATAGWPLAVATIVFAAMVVVIRRRTGLRRRWIALAGAAALSLLISVAINWVKFRHPFMIPLEDQEWTRQNARRRLALLVNDGSLAGFQFFPTAFVNYFRPDGIRFTQTFPFVTLPAEPAAAYTGAFIDQRYRTGSLPAFMPLLFLLGAWGSIAAVARRSARWMILPLAGALGVTVTIMCYGYIGFRYTSEFVGFLAGASALGVADITRRIAGRSRGLKRTFVGAMALLAAFGIYANTAVAVPSARITARGSGLEQFVAWQDRVSSFAGRSLASITRQVDTLPPTAPPDELFIVGECDALYLSTGDLYEPWVTVQVRSMSVVVETSGDGFREAVLPLFDVASVDPRQVALVTNDDGDAGLRIGAGIYYLDSDWQPLDPGESMAVTMLADTAHDALHITMGDWEGDVPLAEWDPNWRMVLTHPRFAVASAAEQLRAGIRLTPELGPELELCNRLLNRAGT